MPTSKPTIGRYAFALCFVLFVFNSTLAQGPAQTTPVQSSLTITAAATDERVRITAPASIVQMHVEVYAPTGEKLFDQEIRGGNVFDWHLQDGQAQRLAPGSYVCVVTAKSTSGKLTQKIGTVTVTEKAASVQPADSQQLSPLQAQVIGPVEENSSWTIPDKDGPQTPTVIASDGKDGQMIRGRGALTFRIGNFFSGVDTEQMRLTEIGDLGIGTSEPKAKLDVAGTIRAERFLVAKPRLADGAKSGTNTMAGEAADSAQPLVAGTGTTGQLTKWTDGPLGALGDSVITESNDNLGISNAFPHNKVDITDTNTTPGSAAINIRGTTTIPNIKYGLFSDLSGASTTNIAGFFDAHGATNNYGLIVGRGNIGFGNYKPNNLLDLTDTNTLINSAAINILGTAATPYIKYGLFSRLSGASTTNIAGFFDAYGATNNYGLIVYRGNVGIGTTKPTSPLTVAGMIASTSGGFKFPDGSVQLTAGGGDAGRRTETTASTPNVISGFLGTGSGGATPGNRVTLGVAGATIGGGGFNGSITFQTFFTTRTGDNSNRVTDMFGTVGGGFGNLAGDNAGQTDNARFATVGGGDTNTADAFNATVAGGAKNTASSFHATVGGGISNTASGDQSIVAGGEYNTASGESSTVGGGEVNTASTRGATVAGGGNNVASGSYATVPGGSENTAQGGHSFAAGRLAKANHLGTFVWADSTGVDFASTGSDQFLIRARGGVGINTTSPKAKLEVAAGDVYVSTQGNGIILKATDGPGCFRVTVNNAGTLTATSITCP